MRTEPTAAKTHPAFRLMFAAAAGMNIAFGVWASAFPASFSDYWLIGEHGTSRLARCLGAAVALYGLLYAFAAVRPDRGDVVAAVGLAGKASWPLGWLCALWLGALRPHTVVLVLSNGVIWWFFFLAYLLRRSRWCKPIVAWVGVVLHVFACVALLTVRHGTEAEPELIARMTWIAAHIPLWTTAWFVWITASMSLLAFFFAWLLRLHEFAPAARTQWVILAGFVLCGAGVHTDLVSEMVNLSLGTDWALFDPKSLVDSFGDMARFSSILGAGIANGLYCLGGLLMSGVSWHAGLLRGWLGDWGFVMWLVGLGLSLATFAGHRQAMVFTGGAVMVLFIPWAAFVGWQLRDR